MAENNEAKPKTGFLIAAIVLLALGGSWLTWSAWLRPPTEDEIKIAKEEKRQKDLEEGRAKAKAALEAARASSAAAARNKK